MKKLIMVALMLMSLPAASQSIDTTTTNQNPSLTQFIKSSLDSAEAGSAFNLAGQKLGSVYVPLRTLDLPWANVIDAGVGGVFGAGHPDGIISARLNLPQIANGIFGTKWFVKSTHGPNLPALFLGPAVKAAWPPKSWRWDHDAFLLLSVPLAMVGI